MAAIDLGQVKGDKGVSMRNRGVWNSAPQYLNNAQYIDVVSYKGSLWMCLETNTNSEPVEGNNWRLAAQGVASIANNLTTTENGSALDARQGPVIKGEIDKIYSNKLLTMDEIDLVTEEGFFVDALAVKELNNNLCFEYGHNEYGYYKKYNDGTLEMWNVIPSKIWITNGDTPPYWSNEIVLVFPIPSVTPCVIISDVFSNSVMWSHGVLSQDNKTSTALRVVGVQPYSGIDINVYWIARGRWK